MRDVHQRDHREHILPDRNFLLHVRNVRLGASVSLSDRIRSKVSENTVSGCWDWTAYKESNGYGVIGVGSKARLAHRVSYEAHKGPIPPGMCVCHRCDNPACVNPDHLFLGSHADNMADMAAKHRSQRGEAHVRAKLTAQEVLSIRAESGTQENIAAKYGICSSQVSRIKLGKTWKHLLGEQ